MASDQNKEDFDSSPQGLQRRWEIELKASKKWLSKWHKRGHEIVKRFVDDRTGADGGIADEGYRLNAFTSNVQTIEAMMYGRIPSVDVSRRFADAGDSVARLAGELLERMLNCDIERANDPYRHVLGYALSDRTRVGLAVARVRYEVEFDEEEPAEEAAEELSPEPEEQGEDESQLPKKFEDAVVDWVFWGDFLYSSCRIWHETRWVAFKASLNKERLEKRFGKKKAMGIPLNTRKEKSPEDREDDAQKASPWQEADVWEIWDKESGNVIWLVEGMSEILDTKPDPLGLKNFFPCPRPMIANPTTTAFVPTPDFTLSKDIYNEIDDVSDRINVLEHALKAIGCYDDTLPGLRDMLESPGNKMIPIPNWPAFQEKGGIKGRVEWFPLDMVVAALDKLRDYRTELLSLVDRISGQADIVRGEQIDNGTPGEAQIKARFASVRMQALQDEFARFASDLQNLRAEVIANLFDVETILARSNAEFLSKEEQPLAQQAAMLIKDKVQNYRIEVKPEAISMQDFAQQKAESLEVLDTIAKYIQTIAPLVQQLPGALPYMLDMLKVMVARLRGSKQLEGILDQAITAAEQAAQQAAQNPQQQQPQQDMSKVMAQQLKNQGDVQKVQMEAQTRQTEIDKETAALRQRGIDSAVIKTHEAAAIQRIKGGAPAMPVGPEMGGIP